MVTKKAVLWALAVLAVVSLLVACAPPATPEVVVKEVPVEKKVVETVVVEKEVPVEKKVVETVIVEKVVTATPLPAKPKAVTIAFFEEPDSLNPMYTGMWFSDLALELVHGGLWTWDENNDFLPDLALEVPTKENGGLSEDGTTITVKLRKGVKWHDGVEVTSADVQFTWEMIMDERNTPDSRYGFDKIESIDTPDDYTVVFHYTEPYAAWWTKFGPMLNGYVLPKHVLEPVLEEEGTLDRADYNRAPIGFGPFKFVEWMSGDHITFEKNTDYWRGEPKLDRIFIKIVESREAMLAALETGEIDVGVYLLFPNIPQVEKMANMHLVNVAAGWFEIYWFNLREGLGHRRGH
jgi:peptide/nickel transport system substrate-binding protein